MAEAVEKQGSSAIAKPKQWWLSTKEFFRDTASEMKKVTWPTKNEVVGTTLVVIAATVLFAVFLWVCDLGFYKAIDFLFRSFGAST